MKAMWVALALPILISSFAICAYSQDVEMVNSADQKAQPGNVEIIDVTQLEAQGEVDAQASLSGEIDSELAEPVRYTLGPDDVIEITVRRHPEFSGQYTINREGKIQYKFVGDINISGMTKDEVEKSITAIVSKFVIEPELDVTILAYRSKIIYVVGEVGSPGKYYMRSDKIPVREAVVQAGLPTLSASMRKTRLIHPDTSGKPEYKTVDLYKLVYEGDLSINVDMTPGDVLYVPATLFAKIVRIINPIAAPVGSAETLKRVGTGGF